MYAESLYINSDLFQVSHLRAWRFSGAFLPLFPVGHKTNPVCPEITENVTLDYRHFLLRSASVLPTQILDMENDVGKRLTEAVCAKSIVGCEEQSP